MRFPVVLTLASIALLSAPMVSAQNINAVESRLDRMEREMQTLSRSVFKGDVPPPQLGGGNAKETAAIELRLNQMDDSIRRLTGKIEEQGYKNRQLEQKIDELMAMKPQAQAPKSSSAAITSMQSSSSIEVTPLPEPSTTTEAKPYQLGTLNASDASKTPAGLYDQAFSYLQTNDYAAAEKTFNAFIEKYPDHSLAANSKYWLGETFYARQDYEGASRAFATSYQDHPEGQKAPDTLLKLAMSLGNQGMKEEACLTLSELQKRFPNGPVSVMKKATDESQSYGCGS